ncbi:hypothetical protein BDZ85DRAFT_842 [Elsinoe ampelina]|uniref:Integral membrane protein, Mpv17/PMP22 family n=1 Tax=Elsinoe ampelina TaxID=302913 RepID=A0A6A6GNA3_9PEZI|nr:hypothetical protein BDZ85DRAFT_842 [Elsinoe ampelina]
MASLDLIIKSTIQAVALSAISNILAQLLDAYNSSKPFSLDTATLTRFIFFSLFSCPPNVLWQSFLEQRFPGYTTPPPPPHTNGASKPRPNPNDKPAAAHKKKLNKANTAKKWALDQTVGALANTVAFVAGMLLLRGERDWGTIAGAVRRETWPLMAAGQKVWPLFSVVSFALVPLEYRTLAGGLVGLGWGTYLSLMEGKKKTA